MAKIEHEATVPVTNPETDVDVYPAMTSYGQPILASGAVEGCDCDACLGKQYDASYLGDSDGETVSGVCRTCGAEVDVTTWNDGLIVRTDANGAEHDC